MDDVTDALSRIGFAPSVESLAGAVVRSVRSLTGCDRIMVYSFDRDGHGEVVAEARSLYLRNPLRFESGSFAQIFSPPHRHL